MESVRVLDTVPQCLPVLGHEPDPLVRLAQRGQRTRIEVPLVHHAVHGRARVEALCERQRAEPAGGGRMQMANGSWYSAQCPRRAAAVGRAGSRSMLE